MNAVVNVDNFDLVSDTDEYETPELVEEFKNKANGVPYLWRFMEDKDDLSPIYSGDSLRNYFYLRWFKENKREKSVSLMQMLDDLIHHNLHFSNHHDLFFLYMCTQVKNMDKDSNVLDLLKCNSLRFVFEKFFANIESDPKKYLDKIKSIDLSSSQKRVPFVHHWGLSYHDAMDCEDVAIIELLIKSSEINNDPDLYTQQYVDKVFNTQLNLGPTTVEALEESSN